MASLEKHRNKFRIVFYLGGQKRRASLRTTSEAQAETDLIRFEENLRLLERGRFEVPDGADIATFLLSDGKLNERPKVAKGFTLKELRDEYLRAHPVGILEKNTRATVEVHFRHLVRTFRERFELSKLTLTELQRHINRRSEAKGIRKKPLSPDTIKKEIATFRASWNWAKAHGHLHIPFPSKGLRYPKRDEKLPFMTRAEIERKLQKLNLPDIKAKDLWDCLYLDRAEIQNVLQSIRANAIQPFVYPMVVLAARTGARRSELLRCLVTDIDLETSVLTLREKKRSADQRTIRQVPLTSDAKRVLAEWLKVHPGGSFLFTMGCNGQDVESDGDSGITRDEAHDHLKRALAKTRWKVIRGWHTFRHSFISNAASAGVDQRIIDDWVGHSTEEMRKRYRHLLPNVQRDAIARVFSLP